MDGQVEQLLIDAELQGEGLTGEMFCAALKINSEQIQNHHLKISLVELSKERGGFTLPFFTIQIFLDHSPEGIEVGMFGYERECVTKTVQSIREAALSQSGLKGIWPKKTPLIQWLKEKLQEKEATAKRTKNTRKPREKKKEREKKTKNFGSGSRKERDSLRQSPRGERLKQLLSEIPSELQREIFESQLDAKGQEDKTSLLSVQDWYFLQYYGPSHFKPSFFDPGIDTLDQLIAWIKGWMNRLKESLMEPSLLNKKNKVILELIASSPSFGVTTYAMWLGKSKAKALERKKLDKKFRHRLSSCSMENIAEEIKKLICDYRWLVVTYVGKHDLPVLELTESGKKVLELARTKKVELAEPPDAKALRRPKEEPYISVLKDIRKGEREGLVKFLDLPESVQTLEKWESEKIQELLQILNEKMPGWQPLVRWKLAKHPVKYKALERLL